MRLSIALMFFSCFAYAEPTAPPPAPFEIHGSATVCATWSGARASAELATKIEAVVFPVVTGLVAILTNGSKDQIRATTWTGAGVALSGGVTWAVHDFADSRFTALGCDSR